MFSCEAIMDHYANLKVKDADIDNILDLYFADPSTTIHVIGDDLVIDVAEAIEASAYARLTLRDKGAPDSRKRHAVWAAVLLAKPYQVPPTAPHRSGRPTGSRAHSLS
ncbi:conserved hypothetical protein [Methylobacterium nodulans ORS 2060]|uniref:Uncharacterized protein n=1 Tax=Methylobacterium nodulans (strain LMG 21967 / CNCM I-2342 / ORS 2060) TaxID=460265 RepID=B8IC16_METNO|nr:conserved hypothetical protein [Methylobacterium nodulans ORS 2060]